MSTGGRLGAYGGTAVGCFGWLIGAVAFAGAHGEWSVALRMLPVGVSASAALAATVIALLELGGRVCARGSGAWLTLLWGAILLLVGVLTLLVNHWLAPLMRSSPVLEKAMRSGPVIHSVPDAIPVVLLLVSGALLTLAMRRFPAREDDGDASPDEA